MLFDLINNIDNNKNYEINSRIFMKKSKQDIHFLIY